MEVRPLWIFANMFGSPTKRIFAAPVMDFTLGNMTSVGQDKNYEMMEP